jgi:hypothetical protein
MMVDGYKNHGSNWLLYPWLFFWLMGITTMGQNPHKLSWGLRGVYELIIKGPGKSWLVTTLVA